MSSSPDVPKGLGRGRGRARGRSLSPRTIALAQPAPRSASPEDEVIIRPGSNSPPSSAFARLSVHKPQSLSPQGQEPTPGQDARGSRRGARQEDDDYTVATRPKELATKIGTKGTPLKMLTNYFKLKKGPMWTLYGYHCYFEPQEDRNHLKKMILKHEKEQLGAYIFDGMKLYTATRLSPEPFQFASTDKKTGVTHQVTLKFVGEAVPGDPTYMHFYHLILRRCLFGMNLEELGRHFYDPNAAINIPAQRLSLWPGFVTTMRQHERDVLLCVETTHKVLRMDNVLSVIKTIKENCRGRNELEELQKELKDTIVLTHYNRKTYKVDDIQVDINPRSTFDLKDGTKITYEEYYKNRYELTISDPKQPMLICRPTKKDLHRGVEGNIILVPEFCQLTGLTDVMRANFSLMKELSKHLHQGPHERSQTINNFMKRLVNTQELTDELHKWGLEFDTKLASAEGRVLGRETIMFANGSEQADDKADWTKAFRSQQMLSTVNMTKWAVIVPQRDAAGIDNLAKTMSKVSKPLNMFIESPAEVFKLTDIRPQTYVRAINTMTEKFPDLQMMFVILPNNKLETYAAVKKRLAVDVGIPSQCFVAKNVTSKGLMSIATKVVVQMNAKLGGEPWTIKLPLKNLMVVGFDVYHGAKGTKGGSIGAMVASLTPTYAKYFSTTSVYNDAQELAKNMRQDFTKCVFAYEKYNSVLPDRVVLFRDGVGEGQLSHVYDVELTQIKGAMEDLYAKAGKDMPKFTFIVVTKKINTRMFADLRGKLENPPPGTILDDVVTIPDRYDFFLVSCAARQGTVSPCCYNVIYDSQSLDPDKMQMLTYKMCHLYFNWSGTVAVPAPCQYAHKLAFITGTAYTGKANAALSDLLHFL